ncbi:MAG: hypothetical protein RIQ47_367 [Bacteroidota bacterium]|jgi:gliding motility-associated-like protein
MICSSPGSYATHIVGGEMYYRWLGNNLYEVKLAVYRDCFNGQAPFDNPASITVFDDNGNVIANSSVYITSQQQVPAVLNSPCLIPPTNLCYEVAYYVYTLSLPPRPGGYSIVYQRCCRNQTIINLANVSTTGGTYIATIPDSFVAYPNSNPVFNELPPTFICQSAPFEFDHSATDADGDSLIYELCAPFSGGSRQTPAPSPADPPPYSPVVYSPPYSVFNMLGGTPFSVDRFTGKVTATPATAGQFVYGICVREYRNGVLIGESRRDFQLNVVLCPTITVASIFSPLIVCGSLLAEFENTSYNAATYSWDFGDPTTSLDTSTLFNPSYVYPDTGIYPLMLIAASSLDPDCNDTAYGEARVYPEFLASFSTSNIRCSPDFSFSDQSFGANGPANFWSWDFGDDSTASIPTPSHSYILPGTYDVTLIAATDSGCTDTISIPINVLAVPEIDFSTDVDTCNYSLDIRNYTSNADEYQWLINGLVSSTDSLPQFQLLQAGNYTLSVIATSDSGCVDSDFTTVQLPPLPRAQFSWAVDPCDSTVSFSNTSLDANSYQWDFGDSTSVNSFSPDHTYELAGQIPVQLIATSLYGCKDTLADTIFFVSYKEAEFNAFQDSCSGVLQFADITANAVAYFWDFGDGTTSTERFPEHSYLLDGNYDVTLIVNGEYACIDSIRKRVEFEKPKGERVFIPTAFTPNDDGLNDLFSASIYKPCENYSITIFNRWGAEVYSAEDLSTAIWDGRFNGELVPSGIYTCIIKGDTTTRYTNVCVIY